MADDVSLENHNDFLRGIGLSHLQKEVFIIELYLFQHYFVI